MGIVYDIETYPNCFLYRSINTATKVEKVIPFFEGVDNCFELFLLRSEIREAGEAGLEMIGFNNLGFDYPVLHFILTGGITSPKMIYQFAISIINCREEDKFRHLVRPADRLVKQVDLFKVHHFDNKARMTSLKALEFNMRMNNIRDLPFGVGKVLNVNEILQLIEYCGNDVEATGLFLEQSEDKLAFRRSLASKYPDYDWMNFSDVKIGKTFFQMRLEAAGVQLYTYGPDGRNPRQTRRAHIALAECVPAGMHFDNYSLQRVLEAIRGSIITQTKGALDLSAQMGGLTYYFGTGGIHASVDNMSFVANEEYGIYDVDVTSLYPSLAIAYNLYPEHLGPTFVKVYEQLRAERLIHKKGTPENAMLKLALNGVYGESNSPFSVFFDPKFTMSITIHGQLLIAKLAEMITNIIGAKIIQANTDGITVWMPRTAKEYLDAACQLWEKRTHLTLEHAEYSRMHIADVNSYIAQTVDGKVKRKGRYEYDVDWHQDASALVVQKVAEKVLLEGADIRKTVEGWDNFHDFMLRIKVPRTSRLVLAPGAPYADVELTDKTVRYYISKEGSAMFKVMPPLAKNPGVFRRIAVQAGWRVKVCNNIEEAISPIDYDWYVQEVEKLVLAIL